MGGIGDSGCRLRDCCLGKLRQLEGRRQPCSKRSLRPPVAGADSRARWVACGVPRRLRGGRDPTCATSTSWWRAPCLATWVNYVRNTDTRLRQIEFKHNLRPRAPRVVPPRFTPSLTLTWSNGLHHFRLWASLVGRDSTNRGSVAEPDSVRRQACQTFMIGTKKFMASLGA